MTSLELESAFNRLAEWCRIRQYAGYDPFDGLNSRLFQALPFRSSSIARLAWTQLFKRSPINLRGLTKVDPGPNPKGVALFALSMLARFRRTRRTEHEAEARSLLEKLKLLRIESGRSAAWGYNFDWQGRAFFAPRGTPTVVPTAFAARAFLEAASAFSDISFLRVARSACDFILQDLHRESSSFGEVCFSYSPVDRTCVFNASLLAAETLAVTGAATDKKELVDVAVSAALYVARRQRADGSWPYGEDSYQSWADNFHTAFILTSLSRIISSLQTPSEELIGALKLGYKFWTQNFFLENGWPKYYPNRLYPADAHSAGAAIVALVELKYLDHDAIKMAETVAEWAITQMQDKRGFFYYQRRRFYTIRMPYMRWSQAWMQYALGLLLEKKP